MFRHTTPIPDASVDTLLETGEKHRLPFVEITSAFHEPACRCPLYRYKSPLNWNSFPNRTNMSSSVVQKPGRVLAKPLPDVLSVPAEGVGGE
jgi:hypothetical protein